MKLKVTASDSKLDLAAQLGGFVVVAAELESQMQFVGLEAVFLGEDRARVQGGRDAGRQRRRGQEEDEGRLSHQQGG